MAGKIILREIARELDYSIAGDSELEINSLKFANDADEKSLAVAYSDKDVINTNAKAVLTAPRVMTVDKTFMYCGFGEIDSAVVKVAKFLIREKIYPDYEKTFAQDLINGSMFGKNFVIGEGTFIAPFVSVGENVIIGRNCKIESGVFIGSDSKIGDNVIIRSGSRVGVNCHYHYNLRGKQKSFCGIGRLIIGDGVEIGCNSVIQRGTLSDTIIGAGTIIGNLVEIAHDVKICEDCLIVSQVGICGNVEIGRHVEILGQAGIVNWVKIGDNSKIMAKSCVTKNVRAGSKVSGMFSRDHTKELKRIAKIDRLIKGE